jgi:hypothetical protein
LYVGETSETPEVRFQKHRDGAVNKHGVSIASRYVRQQMDQQPTPSRISTGPPIGSPSQALATHVHHVDPQAAVADSTSAPCAETM